MSGNSVRSQVSGVGSGWMLPTCHGITVLLVVASPFANFYHVFLFSEGRSSHEAIPNNDKYKVHNRKKI